ncbi:MAG: hypothetical protein ACLUCC_11365, partial [Eggerthella lenta]
QSTGGHTICCPAYACAYGDAILTGQANDHGAYGCGCCTWPGWGGGNSSFRSLGSDEALLREAYDEIAAGRPTVVHVAGPYGEHWICLMGYRAWRIPTRSRSTTSSRSIRRTAWRSRHPIGTRPTATPAST